MMAVSLDALIPINETQSNLPSFFTYQTNPIVHLSILLTRCRPFSQEILHMMGKITEFKHAVQTLINHS